MSDNTKGQERHIARVFDRDLEAVQAMIMKMGGMVEEMILEASEAMVSRDEELARKVLTQDKAVDALEEQTNEEAARVLALRAPAASDLRTVLTVLKISGSLERIGDYAKNMGKRTSVLARMPPVNGASNSLRRMAKAVQLMLKDALDAYIARDAELAADVRLRDEDVDQMYNAVFRELLTHMLEDPRNITPAMHLHFIAKNIERMGDLVTSVAEQVIYLVTGELPGEARPKGDTTPFAGAETLE
ncbi:MAG: phosphate signaling complex protein PhoU [Rhodobacteraceae bacterium]|nr:phosphate signaling complex protein PhoU [Paracoccaceae bacterium]